MRDNRNMLLIFYDVVTRSCPTENIKSQKLFFFYILNNLDNRRNCFFFYPSSASSFCRETGYPPRGLEMLTLHLGKLFPAARVLKYNPFVAIPCSSQGKDYIPFQQ